MDYLGWAKEYYNDAVRVMRVIERKKERMISLPKECQEQEKDVIDGYRNIYKELMKTANQLRKKGIEK